MQAALRRTGVVSLALVAALAALYALLLAALYFGQERLLFPATSLPADYRFRIDQPFSEVAIPVAGATLHALHVMQSDPRGLVFYLKGNGGNVATWTTSVDFWRRVNYDLFILDYRGYGKSTGHIESEAQLHADVRAAYDAIAPHYRGKPVVIVGRSLGSGLAVALARDVAPPLLVLVSPYTSIADAALREYPVAPSFLVRYPLRSDQVIGSVTSPMLLLHGKLDTLIPAADSERLRALARAPVDLVLVDGAGHNDIQRFPAYLDALAGRLARVGTR
jgi:alpha-beta hydrolase superfamily lysophospholipase